MKTARFEERNYNVFGIDHTPDHEDVICVPRSYSGGGLAIEMISVERGIPTETFAILTVNLDCYTGMKTQSGTRAYVDINNNGRWNCTEFIRKYGLGRPTGRLAQSGFCTYPLYEFNTDKFYQKI